MFTAIQKSTAFIARSTIAPPFTDRQPRLAADSEREPAALLVSPDARDRTILTPIFDRQQWSLYTAETVASALDLLNSKLIPVIVSERDLPPYDWRLLFEQTRDLPHHPLTVVVSSRADEYLWSEVLNLGGHDVLAKPFRESEILHVLSQAWDCRRTATDATPGFKHPKPSTCRTKASITK